MIVSLQRVDFIRPSGAVLRLLDFGQRISDVISFGMDQPSRAYSPIGASWQMPDASGGARTSVSWSVRRDHASHGAAHSFCQRHPALMPIGETGQIRVTIREPGDDGTSDEVWLYESAVIVSAVPSPMTRGGFRTMTDYRIDVGRRRPVSGAFTLCDPIGWQVVPITDEDGVIGSPDCSSSPYSPPALMPGTPPSLVS
jgi:hypothetical protein